MSTTPETTTAPTDARRRVELADLVASLGEEGRRLRRPVLICAVVSIGAALLAWSLWFSPYVFDSFKSFVLCLTVLITAVAPGAFLLWLRTPLGELPVFQRRFGVSRAADEEAPREGAGSEGSEGATGLRSRALAWVNRARARLDALLDLRERLAFVRDELIELGGPSRAVAFFGHPAAVFLVAVALVLSVLLVLGAGVSGLLSLFAVVF